MGMGILGSKFRENEWAFVRFRAAENLRRIGWVEWSSRILGYRVLILNPG